MTLPGPIQMLPIPNVAPRGQAAPVPGVADAAAPGLSALANVLALRQRKAELDQQAQELAFRVEGRKMESQARNEAGEVLQRAIVGQGTDLMPAMLSNFGDVGGATPIKFPKLDPLAAAAAKAPPGAVYDAVRLGSGIVSESYRRRAEAQEQATGVKPEATFRVDSQGYASYVVGALAFPILNPDGSRFREKLPGTGSGGYPEGTGFKDVMVMEGPMRGQIVRKALLPGQALDPAREFPLDQIKVDNQTAADFYPQMITAYEQARNTMPRNPNSEASLTTFFGALNAGDADQSALNVVLAKGMLDEPTRRWMQTMLDMAGALVYKKSGKAVTKGEFSRFIQFGIPLPYEDEATTEAKWLRLESQIEGIGAQAEPAMLLRRQRDIPDFTGVKARLGTTRQQQAAVRTIIDRLRILHPGWNQQTLANKALQEYRGQQPLVAPGTP